MEIQLCPSQPIASHCPQGRLVSSLLFVLVAPSPLQGKHATVVVMGKAWTQRSEHLSRKKRIGFKELPLCLSDLVVLFSLLSLSLVTLSLEAELKSRLNILNKLS